MTKATTRQQPEPDPDEAPADDRDLLVDDDHAEPEPYDGADAIQEDGL